MVIGGTFSRSYASAEASDEYRRWPAIEASATSTSRSRTAPSTFRASASSELIAIFGRATSPSSPRSARRIRRSSTLPTSGRCVPARGARGGRVEGDRRGARGRHCGHSSIRRAACAPRVDWRDRKRRRHRARRVRGALEGSAGLVHQGVRLSVYLGNILPEESSRSKRFGSLRGDTLKELLLASLVATR